MNYVADCGGMFKAQLGCVIKPKYLVVGMQGEPFNASYYRDQYCNGIRMRLDAAL